MVNSVLTNYNSLVALQSLQNTQAQLSQVQTQISTGLKIGSAKDDAATWAVSTTMNSSIANLKQVSSNLGESDSVVGLGVTTANSLTSLLSSIKTNITNAQNPANNSSQIQDAINQQLAQLDTTIGAASFQGVNLLNKAGTTNFLGSVNTASDGTSTPSYISVQTHDLTRATGELSILNGLSVEARGDQLFNGTVAGSNGPVPPTTVQSAEQASYATTGSTYNVVDTVTPAPGSGAALASGPNTLSLAYTDASGADRSLNVSEILPSNNGTSTAKDLVSALNSDSNFNSLFHADTNSTSGKLVITAANRQEQTGSFAIGKLTVGSTDVFSTASTSTLTFQDGQGLNAGEQFKVGFTQTNDTTAGGTTTGTVILQVGAGETGKINAYDKASNTITVNVDQDKVSGSGVTGVNIADQLKSALTTLTTYTDHGGGTFTNPFAAAAAGAAATASAASTIGVSASGSTLTVSTATLGTTNLKDNFSIQSPQTDYGSLLNKINSATTIVENAASALGSAQSRIETQQTFVTTLTNALTAGVSGLVDADMSAESARLSALQVQQQLGTQALSIANSTPQSILSLFK